VNIFSPFFPDAGVERDGVSGLPAMNRGLIVSFEESTAIGAPLSAVASQAPGSSGEPVAVNAP
jgi:hypothetical protein